MKLYISSAIKGGEGKYADGGKWIRYDITDPKGTRYAAFNQEKYLGMVGQEVDVTVKEEAKTKRDGTTYINRTIVEPRRNPVSFDASKIEAKLDKILELLQNLVPADEDTPDGPEPENEDPGY